MNKKIIEQLHVLRNYKPDSKWKKKNRELLLSQISASSVNSDEVLRTGFSLFNFSFLKSMPQPMMAAFLILAVLVSGGLISFSASKNAIPGDSLYIAKKINEKAKFVLTFDEKKKTRLGLEFAQKRVAEIHEILKVEGNDGKEERVNELVSEVRKEIQIAQNRMNGTVSNENLAKTEMIEESAEEQVFSAGLEKEEKGLQVSGMEAENNEDINENLNKENEITINEVETAEDSASSSEDVDTENESTATSTQDIEELEENELLQTINELVADLESAIERIDESGEVKGTSEDASTTTEIVD